ncbi:MAG: SGNH/GDSL hydrolase family protein [Coraliomargaritaceae bacterium]
MSPLTSVFAVFLFILMVSSMPARFASGDRVALIGDSITHGGSYHGNLYLYCATRYPNHPFYMFNCGISGDTTPGANRRFESDVVIHEPNVATIMLGMNDAWTWCFSPDEPEVSKRNGREELYAIYTQELEKLAHSLDTIGCRMIFIKPSIYDQTAVLETVNLVGKNDMLGRFSAFIDQLALKYDANVVDFYSLMLSVNKKLQEVDPSATVVGFDRVHPEMPGHFLMTYAFLQAQEQQSVVSSIQINARSKEIVKLDNCILHGDPHFDQNSLSFSCTENALPYPMKEGQKPALEWVPFEEEFNQQCLQVTGLNAGDYKLTIDGIEVGIWSAKELASGINLSTIKKTPQYQQSLVVMRANDARMQTAGMIRSIVHVRHTMFHQLDASIDTSDFSALRLALDAHIEKSFGEPWYDYLRSQADRYFQYAPNEDALRKRELEQMNNIWKCNQPQLRQWEIKAVQ